MSVKEQGCGLKQASADFTVVIPVYNHAGTVVDVIRRCLALGLRVVVVDDGSTDGTPDRLKGISGVCVLRHNSNKGKGAAILTGAVKAAASGRWMVTLDADGQHHPEDIPLLMAAAGDAGRAIVVGRRMGMVQQQAPWTSRFGRGFSNFWVWASGGPRLTDSQSGFRVYPVPEILNVGVKARRFQFEVEVLVKARWQRFPVVEIPVRVTYPDKDTRISHFKPWTDFWRNFGTFSRLITQRILIPWPVRRRR